MGSFEDRWYQEECAEALFERSQEEGVNPIGAVPTGAGKTHIIAKLIEKSLEINPDKRIILLSHVKEILEQNDKSLSEYIKTPIGVYSAMLERREIKQITIAGIQSVYKKADSFGDIGLIIIDECHLITDQNDGMYRSFLSSFDCACVGLTATPYRSRGYLHTIDNALFTEISYDLTSRENFARLIKEGYLSKLYCKSTHMKMDLSDVGVQAGDFNNKQLDVKFNTDQVTEVALAETIQIGKSYKKWLIFAISIDHAEKIREWLNEQGVNTGIVHSKMASDEDRDQMLDDFRSGFYRAMVNVNVLTTGLDIPDIDMIVMVRPTLSPVVYVQSVGRGLRVSPGKDHCLVLDFANNVATHGPIDDIRIREKGKRKPGEAVTKECPKCMLIVHPTCKVCPACLTEFVFKVKIEKTASNLEIIGVEKKQWIDVDFITVNRHRKKNRPDSIRIDYTCGLRRFSQWVAMKSSTWDARHAAKYTLNNFYDFPEDFDMNVENVLKVRDDFRKPNRIFVDQSEMYPNIEKMEFE